MIPKFMVQPRILWSNTKTKRSTKIKDVYRKEMTMCLKHIQMCSYFYVCIFQFSYIRRKHAWSWSMLVVFIVFLGITENHNGIASVYTLPYVIISLRQIWQIFYHWSHILGLIFIYNVWFELWISLHICILCCVMYRPHKRLCFYKGVYFSLFVCFGFV